MYTSERFNTLFPSDSHWLIFREDTDEVLCSESFDTLSSNLGIHTDTLVALLNKTVPGRWPAMLGGRLFILSVTSVHPHTRVFSLLPSTPEEAADAFQEINGDSLFILITAAGKIVAMSPEAISILGRKKNVGNLFNPESSGAISSAVSVCFRNKTSQAIIVSYTSENGDKANMVMSMRRLPSPGNLVYCRLSVPSVAVPVDFRSYPDQIASLLELSFSPAVITDSENRIVFANDSAREFFRQIWKIDPVGLNLLQFLVPSDLEAFNRKHNGNVGATGSVNPLFQMEIHSQEGAVREVNASTVLLPDSDLTVIFLGTGYSSPLNAGVLISEQSFEELLSLAAGAAATPQTVLNLLVKSLGASFAALVRRDGIITTGNSPRMMSLLNSTDLAVIPEGYRSDGVFLHRIHTVMGLSQLVLDGLSSPPESDLALGTLHIAYRVLSEHEATTALKSVQEKLSTVKSLAESFLTKSEPFESLLFEMSRACGAETAVVFRISPNGKLLKSVGSSGVVGKLPEIPLESLNTASWACISGETSFYTDTPENNLRFSPVFKNSRSELAVPYFHGSSPNGVILLASTELDFFHYSETQLVQLLGILFSEPDKYGNNEVSVGLTLKTDMFRQKSIEHIIHGVSALSSVMFFQLDSIKNSETPAQALSNSAKNIERTAARLVFLSKWSLWWLKISLYNGVPDQKWLNPVPLLENVLNSFRVLSDEMGIQLHYKKPSEEMEVCTDGSFVSMIAYSVLACIIDNCVNCDSITLSVDQKGDHWYFRFDTGGDSVSDESVSVSNLPSKENMAFSLAWKLTGNLGGTISTVSNRGRKTRFLIRLKTTG